MSWETDFDDESLENQALDRRWTRYSWENELPVSGLVLSKATISPNHLHRLDQAIRVSNFQISGLPHDFYGS